MSSYLFNFFYSPRIIFFAPTGPSPERPYILRTAVSLPRHHEQCSTVSAGHPQFACWFQWETLKIKETTVPTLLTFLKIIYKLLQYSGLESSINLQWWAPNQDSGWETRLWLGGCAKHKGVAMKRCISYWYWYVNPFENTLPSEGVSK